MRDRRVQLEMINLLGAPTADASGATSPDVIADWFERVIAELDDGPLLMH